VKSKVFISYRREDSEGYALSLYDYLADAGRVDQEDPIIQM
jgi:hypothetical protein